MLLAYLTKSHRGHYWRCYNSVRNWLFWESGIRDHNKSEEIAKIQEPKNFFMFDLLPQFLNEYQFFFVNLRHIETFFDIP